jgi:hypothetical protein
VVVNYRVDKGTPRQIVARDIGTDYSRQTQYFQAKFPPLVQGKTVDYGPVLTNSGRQVPPPSSSPQLPTSFTLADTPAPAIVTNGVTAPGGSAPTARTTFTPRLEFVCKVRNRFSHDADLFGETPDGLRVNYYLEGGEAVGPLLNAIILPRGGDFLRIRTDGVGEVSVRAVFKARDGALLSADYYGFVDLGTEGYTRALKAEFPSLAALQLAPRFLTNDLSPYRWMNRCQFVGVGQVRVSEREVVYDLFAVHNDPVPSL